MNKAIRALLTTLLNQRKIGGNHITENLIINSKTRRLSKEERKDFKKEYKELINNQIILRVKKRTGKGFDWHISLNPKSVEEMLTEVQ